MSFRILVVGERPDVANALAAAGYTLEQAPNGRAAVERAATKAFDLAVVLNGPDTCRDLRQSGFQAGLLLLSGNSSVSDRVVAIQLGADDYLPEPADSTELLIHVEALLRRASLQAPPTPEQYAFADIELDFGRAELRKSGHRVNIPAKELQLLEYLVKHRDRVVPRQEIFARVWDYTSGVNSRTIDVHVARIRQKIEPDYRNPRHLHTLRGRGYRFTP